MIFFYRLPRFNSPIQIFIIRRQSGLCFYLLRSRAVRMKIIARSSVRRFFFAPSLLSLMIPRLLFLQIRFFFSITLHSMRIRSFRCPYFPVGWESQPDRYDAVRFQFPFRYLLRRIGRHALFSSDGLSFRGRQLSLQVRYRTILTIHTLMINLANSSISNYIQRK